MRAGVVWVVALLQLPAAGLPLLSHRAFRGIPPGTRAVLAGLVGAVLLSDVMVLFALLGWQWNAILIFAVAAALSAALRLAAGSQSAPASEREPLVGRDLSIVRIAAAAMIVSVAVAAAATVGGFALSSDLLMFWGPKGQQFALARTIDVAFLRDLTHLYLHISYPPLVTNVYALCTLAAGRLSWGAAAMTFPLGLAALAIGLPGALGLALPRTRAVAVSALAVAAVSAGGVATFVAGSAEMPLLAFEAMAVAILMAPVADRRAGGLLASLLLAGAASSKVEGLAFAVVAACAAAWLRKWNWKAAVWLLLPAALSLGGWFAFGATRNLFHRYTDGGPLFEVSLSRLPEVALAVGRALGSTAWGLPFVVPALAALVSGGRSRRAWIPLAAAIVMSGVFVFTYLHPAGSDDLLLWIQWSAARVFLSVALLLCLAASGAEASGEKTL